MDNQNDGSPRAGVYPGAGRSQISRPHATQAIIHLVFANLKTWLIGIHHGVSHQHLQAYLNEFTFRFNRRFYPFNAFRSLLGIAGDTSAPTYAELYSGEWRHELYPKVDGAVKSCWPMACLYRSLRFGEEYLPVSALLVDKT